MAEKFKIHHERFRQRSIMSNKPVRCLIETAFPNTSRYSQHVY